MAGAVSISIKNRKTGKDLNFRNASSKELKNSFVTPPAKKGKAAVAVRFGVDGDKRRKVAELANNAKKAKAPRRGVK